MVGLGLLAYYLHKRDHNAQVALFMDQETAFTQNLRNGILCSMTACNLDEIEKNLRIIREKEKSLQ